MLVTIVIPVYNAEQYLKECLDSLERQTFKDWEAVCVDDGSTDCSSKILDEYARKDFRIRVVRKKNGGASEARNVGMRMARGRWIGFMDSDDLLESEWLKKVADELTHRQVDMVRCGFKWLFDGQGGRVVERGKKGGLVLSCSDGVMRWGWTKWPREGMVWLCFYRRALIESSGVVFEAGCAPVEDMIFNMKLLPHINSISQIQNDGYLYRQRVGSVRSVKRTAYSTEKILCAGLNAYMDQRQRIADLGLLPLAFKQLFLIVWGNVGSWLYSHPTEENNLNAEMRAVAYRVLEPCVRDRFQGCSVGCQKMIVRWLSFLCGSVAAHHVYRFAFRLAWNARDVKRRLIETIRHRKNEG